MFSEDLGIVSDFDRDLQLALLDQHDRDVLHEEPEDPDDPKGKKLAKDQRRFILPPGQGPSTAAPPPRTLGSPLPGPVIAPASALRIADRSPATWPSPLVHIPGLTPASAVVPPGPCPLVDELCRTEADVADNILNLISQNEEISPGRLAPTSSKKRWLIRYLQDIAHTEDADRDSACQSQQSTFSPIRKLDLLSLAAPSPAPEQVNRSRCIS